ncbi:hypothetical protein J4450_01485 [Candidatus Micrarchaeota archaeon]|nr:hypothetical protein [Candidatus Micrarchaeota archaeon]
MKNISLFLIIFALLFGCNSSDKAITNETKMPEVKNQNIVLIQPELPKKPIERKVVETNDSIIYTNYGFTVTYPKNWELIETNTSAKIVIVATFEDENDSFRENIAIGIEDLTTNVQVQDYAIKNIEDIEKKLGIKSEGEDTVEINGIVSYKVIFSPRTKNEISIKQMQVYMLKDNTAYILTFTSEEKNFDNYMNKVDEIINSFTIN